jgi:hypothetical protein
VCVWWHGGHFDTHIGYDNDFILRKKLFFGVFLVCFKVFSGVFFCVLLGSIIGWATLDKDGPGVGKEVARCVFGGMAVILIPILAIIRSKINVIS